MSTIPLYTPERAHQFQREQEAVLKKIERNYDISEVETQAALAKRYAKSISSFFSKWQHRCKTSAEYSGITLTEDIQNQLNAIASEYVVKLAHADRITQQLVNSSYEESHQGIAGQMLAEIYVNHLTREALSQIKTLGFSDRSSVSLCGQMILKGANLAKSGDFTVQPTYNNKHSTEQTVTSVFEHWKLIRDILNNHHRDTQNGRSR